MKKVLFLFLLLFLAFPVFVSAEQIDINSANLSQLDEIVHVGTKIAQKIIDARPYSSVQDLSRVKGIGNGKYLQDIINQGWACVNCQTTTTQATQNTQITTQEPPTTLQAPEEVRPPEPTRKVGPSPTYPVGIVLNEILPSPEGADESGEWIEIYNQNTTEIDLSGWKVYDTEGSNKIYIFPIGSKIQSNGYLVLKRPITKIVLNNTKDGVRIENPLGVISDEISYTKAPTNQSYNRLGSVWAWSKTLTPGSKNIISTGNGVKIDSTPRENKTIGEENLLASLEQGIPGKKNFTITLLIGVIISILLVISFYFFKTKLNNKNL